MAITLYGFKSCDTVKKARTWLAGHNVNHVWFDYRVEQLSPATVDDWFKRAGWQAVLNPNSTSYKAMSDVERAAIDESTAKRLILADTNLIKRPVLDNGDTLLFGFKPEAYADATKLVR